MRQIGKMCCNSLYGKFGQSSQTTETLVISEESDLMSLLTRLDTDIQDLNITPVTDEKLLVSYKHKKEFTRELSTVNLAVASFITCYGRLKLYEQMEHLGERILYIDTDSCHFIETPSGYNIPLGSYLGDFTDELEKFGTDAYMSEGIFLGPKNYAYEVTVPSTNEKFYQCKVRGISLNYKNKQIINFESMKKVLLEELHEITVENDRIRTNKRSEVYSVKEQKKYRMVFNKRMICNTDPFKSLPFGY